MCTLFTAALFYPNTGSHDTHIFRLAEALDEETLISKLDYPTNLWQAENGMCIIKLNYMHTQRNVVNSAVNIHHTNG